MSEQQNNRKLYTCLILEKDDHIFLIKRGNTGWMDGFWSIPGGGLEEYETITQCIIREAKEEIDITIHHDHLELVHILETQSEDRNAMGFYFSVTVWGGELKNAEPHEHSEIGWFHIDQLPSPIIPAGKHVIEQYKKRYGSADTNSKIYFRIPATFACINRASVFNVGFLPFKLGYKVGLETFDLEDFLVL